MTEHYLNVVHDMLLCYYAHHPPASASTPMSVPASTSAHVLISAILPIATVPGGVPGMAMVPAAAMLCSIEADNLPCSCMRLFE